MKKVILLLSLILLFTQSSFAYELQAGISYDETSAREYVQQGQINDIGPQGHLYYDGMSPISKFRNVYDKNNEPIGIGVIYKDDLKTGYAYNLQNKLIYVYKLDTPDGVYPQKNYRYNTRGKLLDICLTVSKNECFSFDLNGKLLEHMKNGIGYIRNTNITNGRISEY